MSALLAFTLPFDPSWLIALLVAGVCLVVMGVADVRRFSGGRIWAISGVCFRESMRRKILLLIPLAVIGTLVVCQFQRAMDDQDAVRATTKSFLFSTGLIVTLSCILLACTNLPREIDNRVIYTIVTKPTTRMELILGKIVGFARVSAMVLLIMGIFTYGYVKVQSIVRMRDIHARLAEDTTMTGADRQMLQHYADTGLLTARSLNQADSLQIYARQPSSKSNLRSSYGGGEQDFIIPFVLDKDKLFRAADGSTSPLAGAGQTGLLVGVRVAWRLLSPMSIDKNSVPVSGRQGPGILAPVATPTIGINVLDENGYALPESGLILDPLRPTAKDSHPNALMLSADNELSKIKDPDEARPVYAYLPPQLAQSLYRKPGFFILVQGNLENAEIIGGSHPGFVTVSPPPAPEWIAAGNMPPSQYVIFNSNNPIFRGRESITSGEQLRGAESAASENIPVAVFHYRNVDAASTLPDGSFPVEVRVGVERGAGQFQSDRDEPTTVSMTLHDPATDKDSAPVDVSVENLRTAFASLPGSGVTGNSFDVVVRCYSPKHYIDLTPASVLLITGSEPFAWNLTKSLFILWMLTVMVITLSIFASTFLSWPIAVVLTIVLLLGHWAVGQMADTSGLELGRSISTDMGLSDAKQVMVVTTSVDALTGSLNILSVVLPDIEKFAFIDTVEKGVVVSGRVLGAAAAVLLIFGVPLAALSCLILKNKEVAP